MATKAGYVFFMNPKINEKLRDILNYWGKYLQTPASTYVLNTSKNGWLSDYALMKCLKQLMAIILQLFLNVSQMTVKNI